MKNPYLKALFLGCLTTNISLAAINIQLVYTDIGEGGVNGSGITAAQQQFFEGAEATWEKHLTGYQVGGAPATIVINLSGPGIDGAGGILGSAGPDTFLTTGGFKYTTQGSMRFDSADIASLVADGSFESVVFHEMGHVLGIGTLWVDNGLYVDNTGEYTGVNALEKYKRDFDQAATFVPIELDGGGGTANGHWNEAPPATPTANNPFAPYNGANMSDEVMTGFSSGTANFLSDVTLGSFEDMGYTIKYIVPAGPFYWDAGNPTSDGAITSGDGVWDLVNTNWADALDGNNNVPYEDESIIFFGDTGAVVTIATVVKPSNATFSVDGYTITGGTIDTEFDPVFSVTNGADTLILNTTVSGTGSFTLGGAGTVNNTGTFTADVILKDTVTLNNNGTGVINGKLNLGTGTTANVDAGGFNAASEVTNAGTLNITSDQIIAQYTSNGGRLDGAGNTLTAAAYSLNNGSTVNANLGNGAIATNGAVSINGNTGTGPLNIQTGTTTTTGMLGGDINISANANLRSAANTIVDTAVVNNSGNFVLNGNETIARYIGSTTGSVSGVGVLTVGTDFAGGNIITAANVGSTLMLSVDSAGNPVTLGAGTTLTLRDSAIPMGIFNTYTLFHNTVGIIGDGTSIGFENFDTSALNPSIKGVFNVTDGTIFIVSSSAGGTNNLNAISAAYYGLSGAASFINVTAIAPILSIAQMQQLSPEPYVSVADYAIRKQLSIRDAAQYAPYVVRDGKWMFFSGANNLSLNSASSLDNSDYKAQGSGGYVGVSKEFSEGVRYGFYGAADKGDVTSNTLSLDSTASIVGAFAEIEVLLPWENELKYGLLSMGISTGKFDYTGTRTTSGLVNNISDINTKTLQLGISYKAALINGKHFRISPSLGFDYIKAQTDGFTETGSINSLSVSDYTKSQLLFHYGLDATWMPVSDAFGLTASVKFEQNLGDENTPIDANFVASGVPFSITAPGISSSTVTSKLGAFLKITEATTLNASYFQISGDDIDSATGGNLGFTFHW